MTVPNIYLCKGFEKFKEKIERIELDQYKYIYISVGSKINELFVEYEIDGKRLRRETNALYQICPNFLFDREVPILIICIDDFKNETNYSFNSIILQEHLQSNMNCIFYDYDSTIDRFLDYFIPKINVDPNHFMITNFVRFLNNPNMNEVISETTLPEMIYNSIKNTQYNNCFYQWLGYQPNLYNMIMNYKNKLYLGLKETCFVLKQKLYNRQLDELNINEIDDKSPLIKKFLENLVDIKSYYRGENIAYPIL